MITEADFNHDDCMSGFEALHLAAEISKVAGMNFHIAFFPYSRSRGAASNKMKIKEHCTVRTQLPEDKFEIDGENYFLFTDSQGKHQTCYKYLIRFMAFPHDNYKMHKINWYEE